MIREASAHADTPPSSVKRAVGISLIPLLSAPFDQSDLEKSLQSANSGMAALDAAGLQADTLLHAQERFSSLYEASVKAASSTQFFLLCPPFTPQEGVLLSPARQLNASRELRIAQLCAALRASAQGQISLVLPFVDTVQEIEDARHLIEQAMRRLTAQKIPFDETVSMGILLSTPAAMLLSRKLIETADFAVIDTDILAQLALNSTTVCKNFDHLLNENAEAILRLVEMGVGNAHLLDRFVAIGGSLALDDRLLPHFLAMGVNALIVPAQRTEQIKKRLRKLK